MMADANSLRDLSVQQILDRFPETIPVFMRHRMACVGCDINAYETVAEAIAIYQLDHQQFLDKLTQAIRARTEEKL